MKKLLLPFAVIATIALVSCGGNSEADSTNETDSTNVEVVDTKGMIELMLTEHGYDLKVMVPNEDEAKGTPVVSLNDATGALDIKVGENFHFSLMEDDMAYLQETLTLLKSDLAENFTFNNTIITDEENCLVYKSALKNDAEREYYHFFSIVEVGGKYYSVQDDQMGEFKQHHIDKMLKSLKTLAAVMAS